MRHPVRNGRTRPVADAGRGAVPGALALGRGGLAPGHGNLTPRQGSRTPGHAGLDLWFTQPPAPGSPAARKVLREAAGVLDADERRRFAGFLRPGDALLYAAAHLALRRLLGGYLGVPAARLRFRRAPCPGCGGPHGRPALPGDPLHFSLSHTRGLILVGVAGEPVGVDVERVARFATAQACTSAFHPAEQAALAALAPTERPLRLARMWTRKEAHGKALGTGLRRDLLAHHHTAIPGWTLRNLPCPPGHAAAAAVRGAVREVTVRRLAPGRPEWRLP
jgi:4'-phosphopantetheinyl transferase